MTVRIGKIIEEKWEAPPGFEPGVEVLQTSALPLGDGAPLNGTRAQRGPRFSLLIAIVLPRGCAASEDNFCLRSSAKVGAGNGIRTRDFDLGKVALYH